MTAKLFSDWWITAGFFAALGWLAGEVWSFVRDVLWRMRLRWHINGEVKQLYGESEIAWTFLKGSLEAYGAGVLSATLPMSVSDNIYRHHFNEAAIGIFSGKRRMLLNALYQCVAALNNCTAELAKLQFEHASKSVGDVEVGDADYARYGNLLTMAASSLSRLRWYVYFYKETEKYLFLAWMPHIRRWSDPLSAPNQTLFGETVDADEKTVRGIIAKGKKNDRSKYLRKPPPEDTV